MKKILLILTLAIILIVPTLVSAQATECTLRATLPQNIIDGVGCPDTCITVGQVCSFDVSQSAVCCMFGTIIYISNLLFLFLMLLVVIFVILGAFMIITSAGSDEKVKSGRNCIVYAIVGFIAALLSHYLPNLVASFMGL